MNKKNTGLNLLLLPLVILTILAAYPKIFMGFQRDENIFIVMGNFLVEGNHPFKDIKTILVTSSFFQVPFIWLWKQVFINLIGIVLFMRIIGWSFSIIVAIFVYHTFKKLFGNLTGILTACIFHLFTPGWMMSPNYKNLSFYFSMLMILCLIHYFYIRPKLYYIIFAALFLSFCILSYPTMILLYPFIIFLIYYVQKHWVSTFSDTLSTYSSLKLSIVFSFICALCGFSFLLYIYLNTNALPLMGINTILDDKGTSYLNKFINIIKNYFFLTVVAYLPVVFFELLKKRIVLIYKILDNKGTFTILYSIISFFYLIAFYLVKRDTSNANRALFVLAVIVLWTPYINYKWNKVKSILPMYFFFYIGLVMSFSMSIATNDSLNMRIGNIGLIFGLFGLLSIIFGEKDSKFVSYLGKISFASVLVIILLITQTWFVTTSNGVKSTSLQMDTLITDGPQKGIYTNKAYADSYMSAYTLLTKNTTGDDSLLILCSDSIYYLMSESKSATYKPDFFQKDILLFEKFYNQHTNQIPTAVLVLANEFFSEGYYAHDYLYENFSYYIESENKEYLLFK